MRDPSPAMQLAYAAGLVGVTSFVVSFATSAWLPEPSGRELPD